MGHPSPSLTAAKDTALSNARLATGEIPNRLAVKHRAPRIVATALLVLATEMAGAPKAAAAQESRGRPAFSYELRPIQAYGMEELDPDSTYGLNRRELTADAGVLAAVSGVAVAPDGDIYVLDQTYKKIVVFRPDGRVRKVIVGGEGEGPGEFRMPIDLKFGPDGRFFVLDTQLQRISVFSEQAAFERFFRTTHSLGTSLQVSSANEFWFLPFYQHEGVATAIVCDSLGRCREGPFHASERDAAFASHGDGGVLGIIDGHVVFSPGHPSAWVEARPNGNSERFGAEAYPRESPTMIDWPSGPMAANPAGTRGILQLSRDRVCVFYYHRDDNDDPRSIARNLIDVFDRSGKYLGTATVPGTNRIRHPAATPDGRLLFATTEPYPQVVLWELVEKPAGGENQ